MLRSIYAIIGMSLFVSSAMAQTQTQPADAEILKQIISNQRNEIMDQWATCGLEYQKLMIKFRQLQVDYNKVKPKEPDAHEPRE